MVMWSAFALATPAPTVHTPPPATRLRLATAAVLPRDGYVVSLRLGDARGDGPHALRRDELHAHHRLRVGVLQIVDKLRQVFDGVDVVMRRRRDQTNPRRRVAHLGYVLGDLVTWELTSLT